MHWSQYFITYLQETPQVLSIFFFPFDLLDTPHIRLSKWKYQLDIFPFYQYYAGDVKKKKVAQKYLIVKSGSTKAEVGERNLIAPLLTHMFSIDGWFSSIFIITISGSISPLQDGYPICGLPISCAFPSSGPPLGHINISSCHKPYHRLPEQVWKQKKWNGNVSRLLCVKLKYLVRKERPKVLARMRLHKNVGILEICAISFVIVNQALTGQISLMRLQQ